MSFGSDMGEVLTSSNKFEAQLTVGNKDPISIYFDVLELESYIKGYQLRIRLGLESNPGSENELTLEADGDGAEHAFNLTLNKTYIIGPGDGHIHAALGLENYVAYLPHEYWGSLEVNSIDTDVDAKTVLDISFSLGWEGADGNGVDIAFTSLKLNT